MNSTQLQNLIAKLESADCKVEEIHRLADGPQSHHIHFLIWRKTKPPKRIIVTDHIESGYSLFLEVSASKIDDDVAAIKNAEPNAGD